MGAANDLEKMLRAMSPNKFVAFGILTGMMPKIPPSEQLDTEYHITRFMATEHHNPPVFEQILRAAGIPSDKERAESQRETQTKAMVELADQARRANAKSGKAMLIAWISLTTAIIGLVAGVIGLITALVKSVGR